MPRPLAALMLLFCTMLWGFAFVAQKSAMAEMGALTFAASRYLLGGFIVLPLAVWEYRRRQASGYRLSRRHWLLMGALSINFFLGSWLQQVGLAFTTVTNGGFLTALYVLFVPAIAFLAVRAKPHPIIYLGIPLALTGIFYLNGGRLDGFNFGDLLIVVSAVFWGMHVFLLGLLARETGLPIFVSGASFLAAGALSLGFALGIEAPSVEAIAGGWLQILYAGVLSTAVAFTLQAVGQQYVPAANAAIILSAEALFAALGGAVVLGERLPLVGYAGATLIFLAILLVEAVPALQQRRATAAATS
jgi:drug/metabolite transporter (DMT)-like permease